jgi:hypothetical protein
MAFVLKQSATYIWPITLVLPVDGGKRQKHTFDGELRRLPQSRISEIIKLAQLQERGALADDEELRDQDAAKEVLVGWANIVDDEGEDVPFSDSKLNELLEIPTVAGQIVRAWFDSLEVAKHKN